MTTETEVHEKLAVLLRQIRGAHGSQPLVSTLVELGEASLACLTRSVQLQGLVSGDATRLPGVRLQGVDRSKPAVSAVGLVCRAANLLAATIRLLSETNGNQAELQTLAQQATQLEERLGETSGQALQLIRRETQILNQAMAELQAESDAYLRLKTNFEAQRGAAGGNAAELRLQVEQERQRLEQLENEADSLRSELAEIQHAVTECEALAGQFDAERQRLEQLQRQHAQTRQQRDEVRREIIAGETKLAQLLEQLESDQPEAARLREEREQLQREIDAARQHVDLVTQMREELQSLENQKQQDEQEIQAIRDRHVELQTQAAELREQLDATRHLVEAAGLLEDAQAAARIRQIWQELSADAIDERLKGILGGG